MRPRMPSPAALLGRHAEETVAQRLQRRTVCALVGEDPLGRLGDLVDCVADGEAIVGEHDEPRTAVAHLVRHVEQAAGERHRPERPFREDVPNAVVELPGASADRRAAPGTGFNTLRLALAKNRVGIANRPSR